MFPADVPSLSIGEVVGDGIRQAVEDGCRRVGIRRARTQIDRSSGSFVRSYSSWWPDSVNSMYV